MSPIAWIIVLAIMLTATLITIGWLLSSLRSARAEAIAAREQLQREAAARTQLEQDLVQTRADLERARAQAAVAADAAAAEARREETRERLEEMSDAELIAEGDRVAALLAGDPAAPAAGNVAGPPGAG